MANLNANDKWFKRNRTLTTLIPLLICGLGLALVSLNHTPDAHLIGEIKKPGYTNAPAEWQIEASSAKEWGDYWSDYWAFPVLAFVIMIGFVYGYITYVNKEAKEGSWIPIAIIWLIGLLLIVLPFYHMVSGGAYETKLTQDEYDRVKDALDLLFPIQK